MFSNGNLKTPQFFIFHSSFFIFPRRGNKGTSAARPYGWRGRGAAQKNKRQPIGWRLA